MDVLFDCPYEMHQLSADPFISGMIENSQRGTQRSPVFFSLCGCFAILVGSLTAISARLQKTIHKIVGQMYDHLCSKPKSGLTLRERRFLEEYSVIAKKQGKDAVIRRENKTKRRKKKNRP